MVSLREKAVKRIFSIAHVFVSLTFFCQGELSVEANYRSKIRVDQNNRH